MGVRAVKLNGTASRQLHWTLEIDLKIRRCFHKYVSTLKDAFEIWLACICASFCFDEPLVLDLELAPHLGKDICPEKNIPSRAPNCILVCLIVICTRMKKGSRSVGLALLAGQFGKRTSL